jgi:SAM-dependent methyltransferase
MQTTERYTPGYSPLVVQYMSRRRAERDAAFLLPHLRPGMSVLDCGCGPGTITSGLAHAVSPGRVIGVDCDRNQVLLAQQSAARLATSNLRVGAASLYALPFADSTFDAVFAHALFEHLSDPPKGLREIYRVLRPGGITAISSPDWTGTLIAPPYAAVRETMGQFTKLQQDNGGNPYAGSRLGEWLEGTGFVRIRLSGRYDCYEDPGLIIRLMAERLKGRNQSAGQGDALDANLERLLAAAEEWAARPGVLFGQAFVEAIAFVSE